MKLSIIIVNYNLSKEIDDCLTSFHSIQEEHKYEIIIVDNNSPDKKLPEVEKKFSNEFIRFYYLDENGGFGKGCNYGFAKATGEYVCFLNPDTLIEDDLFEKVINKFENDKSVGIIGPKQQVRKPFFDFSAGFYPNIFFELFNLAGLGVFFEGFLVNSLVKFRNNKPFKVDWILGAALFIRSDIFRKVNGFDKDYFMFFEEVDLCRRVKNLGFSVIYWPDVKIHHIGSVSGKKDYTLYTIRTYSSKNIYISKHYHNLYKLIMKSFLFIQLFSQMIIWSILVIHNSEKSKQKISAFFYLLKNKMRLN